MAYEIDFKFEDLAININGIQVGLFTGSAVISVLSDGDFSVDHIYLDGEKDGKSKTVELSRLPGTSEGALWLMIFHDLTEGSFKISVQDAVDAWREEYRAQRRVA